MPSRTARSSSLRILCDQLEHTQRNLEQLQREIDQLLDHVTELKQAGFHVIIIGHLGRKYRAQEEGGLHDEGLRVLADEQIAYEADAILLVEREGDDGANPDHRAASGIIRGEVTLYRSGATPTPAEQRLRLPY